MSQPCAAFMKTTVAGSKMLVSPWLAMQFVSHEGVSLGHKELPYQHGIGVHRLRGSTFWLTRISPIMRSVKPTPDLQPP